MCNQGNLDEVNQAIVVIIYIRLDLPGNNYIVLAELKLRSLSVPLFITNSLFTL